MKILEERLYSLNNYKNKDYLKKKLIQIIQLISKYKSVLNKLFLKSLMKINNNLNLQVNKKYK